MIRPFAAVALLLAVPAAAQAPLPTNADPAFARSLAAGYKALMRSGALANQSDASAFRRTTTSVDEMELTGIYPELEPLMPRVTASVFRGPYARISYVAARYGSDGAEQFAVFREGKGCALAPHGTQRADLPRIFPDMLPVEGSVPVLSPPPSPGFTPRLLDPLKSALAGKYGERTRTTAVLVTQDGKFVDSGYAPGYASDTKQRTWSVAKSIAATLIGAAVQRGETKVSQSAGLGRGPADPLRAITIDNLLRMASGRTSETPGNRTDALYFGGYSVDETALGGPLAAKPRTVFRYANNDTLAAVKAIAPTFAAHPPSELFRKLGMLDTIAETDWKGDYVLSSQVWSTAPDLARLGNLYLNDGKWGKERILPKGWRA